MSALFVKPLAFASAGGNASTLAPISNANVDVPGMTWRSNNLTTIYCDLDLGSSASYNTVALIGTNLRASDTVQIVTGTTAGGSNGYVGSAVAAWSGTQVGSTTASIALLPSVRSERYVRISLSAPSHPAGYTSVQRIVVGKAVSTLGLNYGTKTNFEDRSIITSGPGYRSVDEYDVVTSCAFKMDLIPDAQWYADWAPLLSWAGSRRALLMVPQDDAPTTWQNDAIFGCITSTASGEVVGYNARTLDMRITALSD